MVHSPHLFPPQALTRVRKSKMGKGLRLLLEATECANETGKKVVQYSLCLKTLEKIGLNENAIRWLISMGYLIQLVETSRIESTRRELRKIRSLSIFETSCFALTPNGVALARFAEQTNSGLSVEENGPSAENRSAGAKPIWRIDCRELYFDGHLVKKFRVPAKNQIAVLEAFQEENWPFRIDNPIVPMHNNDDVERLHDTIKRLNQRQQYPLIRFQGDGTGFGVIWKRATELP